MKVTKKARNNLLKIFITALILLVAFFSLIIWQTAKTNKLESDLKDVTLKNNQTINENMLTESKIEYYQSQDYKNDIALYEYEKGESGEEIYK